MVPKELAHALSLNLAEITRDPHSITWSPFRAGVRIHHIYGGEKEDAASSALLLYEPGARIPRHTHAGYEHVFVLSGSQTDENGEHRTGSFVVNPPRQQPRRSQHGRLPGVDRLGAPGRVRLA